MSKTLVAKWRAHVAILRSRDGPAIVEHALAAAYDTAANELEAELALPGPPCAWTADEDGVWETTCGRAFVFIDAGPRENQMGYCCYCGKPLEVK